MRRREQKKKGRERSRPIPLGVVLFALLAVASSGCGSGGGDSADGGVIGEPVTASFTPNGTTSSPDLVRLTGSAEADLVTLQVVISGQTESDDLFAFAFDLVLSDGGVAGHVDGTAEFGDALTLAPGQDGVALASQEDDRVTVGVAKLGGDGNGVPPTEKTIVTLHFRVTERSSTTIAIDTTPGADPAAIESDDSRAPGVIFDGAAALIRGS